MAVRTDLTIDWSLSPRLITIASPSVEITIQDLVDTLREAEHDHENLGFTRLIDAAGKEPLGGGVLVGITATLQNAYVAFEARPGPTWVLCTISGGNLVAVDSVGNPLDPRFPTAFVTIDRTSSSSATLQDLDSLQAATYAGKVAIDVNSSNTGTLFPVGTTGSPVNNVADAITIAVDHGLRTILVMADMTMSSGDFSAGYLFEGISPVVINVTLDPGTNIINCMFTNMTIAGTMDGGNTIKDCHVGNVTFFNGGIHDSALEGTITLGGTVDATIFDCWSNVSGGGPTDFPSIDMGGSGQSLALRGYAGGIGINNSTGSDASSIDMNSGRVIFDATCTGGDFVVRGVADVLDNSVGATVTDLTLNSTVDSIEKVVRNKTITDPDTGIMTVYDDDGTTVLFTANIYEGKTTSQPYRGQGAERRERLV